MNRIKVVLINSFSNPQVREKLNLRTSGSLKGRDYGGWNTDIINGLKQFNEIELHVVTNHSGMKNSVQEFELDGVYYHFYNPDSPYPWSFLDRSFLSQKRMNYPRCRRVVKQFIKDIQPDIVNLIGAENTMRSLIALDIEKIPLIIHLQTVYANPARITNAGGIDKKIKS
jgi:UDP-N-acetylglucosamine:LPS N-acetylglucosamine transferase